MSTSPARLFKLQRPPGMTRRTVAIATACAGGFLAFLDTTVVNTAFGGIAASFPDATPSRLAWVLDAYFIVIAALLVPAGGLADRVGRKRVFLLGTALFTLASAACAAAPGWEVLVAARALQGAGAAVIMAVSLALLLPEYPLARRASAVSLWGASAALAAASGPPLGGLLVQSDWRLVFAVNLPLGLLVYAVGRRALTESADTTATGVPDLLGAAFAMLGLGALALAILEGGSWGWASPRIVTAFALAVVLLALTALRCLSHPRPVIDPDLLRIESFARANAGLFLLGMAFFSTILANVLFLTGVWDYSLLRAGFAVVPGAIATTLAALPAGRFADRHGHRAVIVPGCLLYVAGMAIVRNAGDTPAFLTTWLPAMVLNGAGLGMAFPTLAAAALKDVPAARFGSASAISSAARQFGGVIGTAALFAVGAPVTLAAADDVYLLSTLWALGAAVVAATLNGRVLSYSLGAVLVTGALILAAPAAAATNVTVTFETGPALDTPITNEYGAAAFVSFAKADAPRPYRKTAATNARSGATVANIGADLCERETPDDCDLPIGGTAGRLTRTASAIKLYAGLLEPSQVPLTVQLIAYRADGSVAATGAETPVSSARFTTEVSVTSAAADIALFRVRIDGNGAIGAKVGFDDLTLVYPDNALPDVSLSVPPGEVAIEQGKGVDIPVTVNRLNGSAGPLTFSASGLPQGVTAQFTGTTLRLTAAPDAPRTPLDVARDVTITGTPRDGDVAPAPRSTKLPVRVFVPFALKGPSTVALAGCASTEVALVIERDRAFTGTIHLAAKNLPAGVAATFAPGPEILPGGPINVDVKLRLSAAGPVVAQPITVEADGKPITIGLEAAANTARIAYPAGKLIAPRQLQPGNLVVVEGDFCPGTRVRVGTAETDVTQEPGLLRFTTPRLATTGTLTVIPPAGAPYVAANVEVDTFRSTKALPFENYDYNGLSYEEALDAFGANDLLTQVNPCYPFGHCTVTLPIPDPTAVIMVPVVSGLMKLSAGHCFGFARAEQGWVKVPSSLKRWTNSGRAFAVAKTPGLGSYLDGQHATQASAEFIAAWAKRKRSIAEQLGTVRNELAKGGLPMVSVRDGWSGHAVLAYDIVDHADGRADILVADSNVPFLDSELSNGVLHQERETRQSVIRIAADRNSWELDLSATKTWRGGHNTLYAFGRGVIGEDPTLAGLSLAKNPASFIVFGSDDGSVRTSVPADSDDYLPVLDAAATPGAAGVIEGDRHTVTGVKDGTYREAVIGDGTVAAVEAKTADGANDTVRAVDGGLALAADGPVRDVKLDIAAASGSATLTTRASGEDVVRLDGAKLVYTHTGEATAFAFTLRKTLPGGGSDAFESERLRVASGDTVTAERVGERVRLRVRDKAGKVSARELRNQRKPSAKLTVTRVTKRGDTARATIRISGLRDASAAGTVVLRATRGGKTVARKLFILAPAKNGSRTLVWRLPARDVRLSAHATLAAGGTTLRRTRVA